MIRGVYDMSKWSQHIFLSQIQFMHNIYSGAGYHLVAVKDSGCNVSNLTNAVTSKIPSAILESEINAEVTYLLPDDQSDKFADLFRFLDSKKSELGIVGFGTSATTMEEVFLK